MPDAWHAQPIVGVDLKRREIMMANPIKTLSELDLEATIASSATLRIRGNEVLHICTLLLCFTTVLYYQVILQPLHFVEIVNPHAECGLQACICICYISMLYVILIQ